jgi:hypothetical protein
MQETRRDLAEKLETLEQQVTDTVATVREAVQDTVGAVRDSFDLPLQVRRHPWLMVGASMAVGYAGARLLEGLEVEPALAEGPAPRPMMNGPVAPREGRPAFAFPHTFADEIDKLKALAIGTALGAARDMIVESASPELAPRLAEIIDGFTSKLGGDVIPGPVLKHRPGP